jgi:Mrp family chromosome partitioning ATPase
MSLSATLSEIEQIFIQLELEKVSTVCVTADKSGAGTTSVAMALTERYLLAGYKTLLVDFNLFNPSFSALSMPERTDDLDYISHNQTQQLFSGIQAPISMDKQLRYRDPSNLQRHIAQWLTQYDKVVFDTTAITQCNQSNIPTVTIANAVDSTLVVLSAGNSNTQELGTALSILKKAQATVGGIILNTHQQASFADDLTRWMVSVPIVGQRLSAKIKAFLARSSLFRYGV